MNLEDLTQCSAFHAYSVLILCYVSLINKCLCFIIYNETYYILLYIIYYTIYYVYNTLYILYINIMFLYIYTYKFIPWKLFPAVHLIYKLWSSIFFFSCLKDAILCMYGIFCKKTMERVIHYLMQSISLLSLLEPWFVQNINMYSSRRWKDK
jgi:hypothetical protein